ncbi:PLC-like phosphodiesterase [Anaeromyces robustus]|uniref:PLC-like phosphodiesterase n=1 Tax=Anaeromyces robustus TaxID=1754192 RepID=A0A1Y1WV40_9FUNG|nr:PLC-like phosphodiesterase [Anaeromyces robustus]|eukprot:ORX77322.1 PLC-like phosphodiesterase [Anaeromyces robustus]
MHFNTRFLLTLLATVSQFGSSSAAGWTNADSNWMNFINGNWKLNQINIPGTHDSGTYNIRDDYGWIGNEIKVAYARTQDLSIMKQLESGIRYLDIRLGDDDDDDVIIVHGDLYGESLANGKNDKGENLTLKQVLNDCRNFLNTHVTETIIIHLKNESNCKGIPFFDAHQIGIDSGNCLNSDRQKIVNNLTSNKNYYFTEKRMPKLNEVRGKIVVATRETDYNGMYLTFPGNRSKEIRLCSSNPSFKCAFDNNYRCCIQDAYELAENEKWEAIIRIINEQNKSYNQGDSRIENTLDINFMSTTVGTLKLVANSLKKN